MCDPSPDMKRNVEKQTSLLNSIYVHCSLLLCDIEAQVSLEYKTDASDMKYTKRTEQHRKERRRDRLQHVSTSSRCPLLENTEYFKRVNAIIL
jgi:hypothetical protein